MLFVEKNHFLFELRLKIKKRLIWQNLRITNTSNWTLTRHFRFHISYSSNFKALFKTMEMKKGIGPWELALN